MAHDFRHDPHTAVAETAQGRVRGFFYDGVSIFKGIPYARAERFHAPCPIEPWEGELDATSFGYACPLLDMPKPAGELLVPHRYWIMEEDCLNLNIWTPGCDGKKRPVLVWLHGGGYEAGSAIEQIAYEGENMSRRGNVVVVSLNHRLNILGYFDLSAFGEEYANSGNAGMDDIIAALRWVRENIAGFGGDPKNVTLFGQSGGGGKITTLLQMPAADGLFQKGINMSGVIGPMLADAEGNGEELACAMMKELGVSTVKELETVPCRALADAYLKVRPALEKAGKYVGGRPHPNAFYAGDPSIHGFRKESGSVALLVGSVYGEFAAFAPLAYDRNHMSDAQGEQTVRRAIGDEAADRLLPLFEKAYPERNPVDLLTLDYLVRPYLKEYVRLRSALCPATWSYLFNLDLPLNGGTVPWHCADIPYVFGNTELVATAQEEGVTERLESEIFHCVIAFARTGDPNHPGIVYWPACTPESEPTLVVDKATGVRVDYDEELIRVLAGTMREAMERNKLRQEGQIQH